MMGPLCSSSSLPMGLTATVYFMVVLTTCSTNECRLQIAEKLKDTSAIFTATDIKLLQIQCMEDSCRQSDDQSKKIEKTDGSSVHWENQPEVPTKFCGFNICKKHDQCLDNGCKKICRKVQSLCDLHTASRTGDLSKVTLILSQGRADINCQEWIGRTPVMWAAIGGHREVVELLVSKGANVSLVDKYGINILHSACMVGDIEMVKYALSQNMLGINGRARCKRTPVLMAAENGNKDLVDLLVGKGPNLEQHDGGNNNILHCACRGGDMELVKYILSLDMYNIETTQRGDSAVMIAAKWGHKEVVELLVQLGASLSKKAYCKDNILHLPCYRGHLDVVKYLLSLNVVDINKKGWYFRTPVMTAAARGHREVVELLVKHGAVLTFKEGSGDNILHLASKSGNLDLVKYVVSLNAVDINSRGWMNKTALMKAGSKGFKAGVELLVTNGADVSLKDERGKNLRYYARGSREIMAYLKSVRNLKHQR